MDDISENTFRRSFEFKKDSFDEEKREVMLSFSSETDQVKRWFGTEVLSHRAGAMDLKRLRAVGSLLFSHSDEIIGPIKKVQVNEASGRGEALVGFDETPEGNKRMLQVKNKSLRGVSLHYRVKRYLELAPGEEYQLGSKTIKGRKDDPIIIAEKWEPTELSLLPQPYDDTVGVGRSLTRSLKGIELINFNKEDDRMADENKNTLDTEAVRSMVTAGITEALKAAIPDIVTQTKNALKEDTQPKLRVSPEVFRDLTNRASAMSPEAMNEVTNRLLDGKTEPEVLRYLTDELTKTSDADNPGVAGGGDGSKRVENKTGDQNIRSFKDVSDDQIFNTLKNPSGHIYN